MDEKKLTKEEQLRLAAELLHISEKEAAENSYMIPETEAMYCYSSRFGGGAIIVDLDGSVLYAASCISPDTHKGEFLSGMRTDL